MPVRAPGTIQLDERRISVISLRAEAFVDKVENVTTGSEVRKGQPLVAALQSGNRLGSGGLCRYARLSRRHSAAGLATSVC